MLLIKRWSLPTHSCIIQWSLLNQLHMVSYFDRWLVVHCRDSSVVRIIHITVKLQCECEKYHNTTAILRPFFRDHPGELVPEENFWTLWCKGRLIEADTLAIRLGATPSGLTSAHLHHPPFLGHRLDDDLVDFNSGVSVRPSVRPQNVFPISI